MWTIWYRICWESPTNNTEETLCNNKISTGAEWFIVLLDFINLILCEYTFPFIELCDLITKKFTCFSFHHIPICLRCTYILSVLYEITLFITRKTDSRIFITLKAYTRFASRCNRDDHAGLVLKTRKRVMNSAKREGKGILSWLRVPIHCRIFV